MTYILSVFNTGQITIPKVIRDKKFHGAKKLVAEETEEGLIIKNIPQEKTSKVVYYESQDGKNFGIHFPDGVEPEEIIQRINLLHE